MAPSDQSHLSVDVLHRLMRLFMEHKTDVLPIVERGRITGEIDRLAIMEALSEIRPEGYMLQIKAPESADELLRRLDAAGLQTLATINRNFEFNALLTRAEILQGVGRTPQVKIWTPPTEPEPVKATFTPPPLPEPATVSAAPQEPQVKSTFTIIRETTPPQVETRPAGSRLDAPPVQSQGHHIHVARDPADIVSAGREPRTSMSLAENIHRDIERGRLAINTLAALDLPLMACDGSGSEIFHNRAFADIRLKDTLHLKSDDLVARAKDAIAESALKGDLDIDKAVRLKAGPRGFDIFCKAIRNFDEPTSKAVGYIFWLVAASEVQPLRVASPAGDQASYSGQTLPEILAAEEAKAMAWAMREADGNQSDAALLLGIPRQTFNYRYRRLTRAKNVQRKPVAPKTAT